MNFPTSRLTSFLIAAAQQLADTLRRRFPTLPLNCWPALGLLALASAATCGLWAVRVLVKERLHHLFLPWNLLLAWLPLGFALAALHLGQRHGWRSWKPWLAAGAWLLFFPNAPYIFTDLVHLSPRHDQRFWIELVLILFFAWPGFLVGCLSLRLLHERFRREFNPLAGWLFAATSCGLAGLGVYIGRFLRWNSWDVITNPFGLAYDLLGFLGHPLTHPAYRFTLLFAALLFVGYATLLGQSSGRARLTATTSRS